METGTFKRNTVGVNMYTNPISLAGGEERFVCPQSLALNTYVGCKHDCTYCCSKYLLSPYKHWRRLEPADTNLIRKMFVDAYAGKKGVIYSLLRMKIPFRFSNLTDPLQRDLELEHRATLKTFEILRDYQYPAIITTKSDLWTEPEYLALLKEFPSVVQMTITTIDDDLASRIEPGAPVPSKRVEALQKGKLHGIITQVRYSPVFPLLTDQPEDAFKIYSESGVRDIICEFLRLPKKKSQQKWINDALGFDYVDFLKRKKYPLEDSGHWIKVAKHFIFEEYLRFKSIALKYGMDYYICCEEKPELNNFENCCGTSKYYGFEKCLDWTIQVNGKKFSNTPLSFDEYIKDTLCPYTDEYRKFYEEGKHERNIYGLLFDPLTKTYRRTSTEKYVRLFE